MIETNPSDSAVPEVRVERWIAVARERVFAALTRPELLMRWWGPESCTPIAVDVDLRVGGRYRYTISCSQGEEHTVSGEYLEIAAPERLVFTWAWSDRAERRSQVRVHLREDGARTHLTLVHEGLLDLESARSHEGGWLSGLDCLDGFLTQGDSR